MKKKITCKTGLKEEIINKEVFDREVALCHMLSRENNGTCGWGVCAHCGVIPLLVKLHKGELLEKPNEISKIKHEFLNLAK